MCRLEIIIGSPHAVISHHNQGFDPAELENFRHLSVRVESETISTLVDWLASEVNWTFPASTFVQWLFGKDVAAFDSGRSSEMINALRGLDAARIASAYGRENLEESIKAAVDVLIEAASSLTEDDLLLAYVVKPPPV